MTWDLMHFARMLKDAGGIPAHGNQRSAWDAGARFDFANPNAANAAQLGHHAPHIRLTRPALEVLLNNA
jgi:hypothetical protein